jgi:hypothetical protein
MQLYAISGWPQIRAIKGIPSGAAAWRETLALAIELDDVDYQLRATWALWVDRCNNGEAAEALALADRFAVLAERAGDSQDRVIGQRMREMLALRPAGATKDVGVWLRSLGFGQYEARAADENRVLGS